MGSSPRESCLRRFPDVGDSAAGTPPRHGEGQPPAGEVLAFGVRVLHHSPGWIAVDKPTGLPTGTTLPRPWPTAVDAVRAAWQSATGPMQVHRLDKPTSGVLVIALERASHRALVGQFQARTVRKTYVALVEGRPAVDEGLIDAAIGPSPNDPRRQALDPAGRQAVTRFRLLAHDPRAGRSLLRLEPMHGRTHQLRVHLAGAIAEGGLACPIVGDAVYGAKADNARAPAERLMLHARALALIDPSTGSPIEIVCPEPFGLG